MARTPSPQSVVTSFIRWIRLKNYQYEVTFALYMLTPTEKLIFSMFPFLDHPTFLLQLYEAHDKRMYTVTRNFEAEMLMQLDLPQIVFS